MTTMKHQASACLIGDLVGSRSHRNRRGLHRRVTAVLAEVDALVSPRTPLRIIAGDEYQGRYDSIGAALAAAFRIQTRLWPDVQVRHGVGWGAVGVLDDDPTAGVMDGPGWWAARAAIGEVDRLEERSSFALVRTSLQVAGPDGGAFWPLPAVEAALHCRDHLVGSLSVRSQAVLAGLAEGLTQAEIAEREQVSASAVSQRVRKDGLALILDAQARLETL